MGLKFQVEIIFEYRNEFVSFNKHRKYRLEQTIQGQGIVFAPVIHAMGISTLSFGIPFL